MWRSKKFITIAVLSAVLLAGSIGGIALAQTGTGDTGQSKTLLDRVAEILVGKGINVSSDQLQEAFTEAQSQMRDEALDSRLQALVTEGKINQEQADQYKTWANSRPDMGQYRQQLRDWQQTRPGIPSELKDWQDTRPDVPLPGPFGGRGFGGGMRGGGGGCFGGR